MIELHLFSPTHYRGEGVAIMLSCYSAKQKESCTKLFYFK